MDNINTLLTDLPSNISAFVVSNSDMSYTIILNSKLSHEQNLISYEHEIQHIQNGDYDKKCSVDLIEISAHSI